MVSLPSCPDASQFAKLVAGQLLAPDVDTLLDHLQGCQTCVQRVETLSGKDTLVELIRQAKTPVEPPAAGTVARLVDQLRQLRPDAEAPKAPPDIRLSCSSCGKGLKVKAALAGKKVKCPHCQAVIPVPGDPVSTSKSAPPPVADDVTVAPDVSPPRNSLTAPRSSSGASQLASKYKELCDFLAPPQAPGELGRLGPYRILKVLGAGGMGVVFEAEDPQLQRIVALKAMLPGLATSQSAKDRFLREARAAAKLKHDHIVTIHQVAEDRGAPYLAMEFLEGEPLDDRLHREGKLPLAEVLRIGKQIADGLAAAHERGLIHRDIKPANIWLETCPGRKSGEPRVKILDFGLARASSGESQLTQDGAIVGTPAYMAPEQAQGKNVGPRCDLFSLGCVLYRMATGEQPFKGADMISTLVAVSTHEPTPPVSLNLDLPTELSDLIMQMLAKKADERPESAQAVAEVLEQMSRMDIPVRPDRTAKENPRQTDKYVRPAARRIAVGVAAAVVLLPLLLWLSGFLVRVESKDGTLIIKSDDPTAAVKITPEGGATLTYGKERREIHLKPGKYGIELAEVKAGQRLSLTQFTIASGDNRTIEVVWEKKVGNAVTGTDSGATLEDPRLPAIAVAPFGKQQAREYQEAWARYLGRKVVEENSIGMKFVLIPPGKFLMGSHTPGLGGREQPQHEVEITQPFYLGVFEVTQEQYQAVMAVNPSRFSATGIGKDKVAGLDTADFPVEMVSWLDAVAFCRNLMERSKEAGQVYDLPTEAEWEYACRAGTDMQFSYGSSLSKQQANCAPAERTEKVGSFQPNAFGLFDMHGNVAEFCKDWLTNDYYRISPVRDPQGPESGTGRTTRGGNYMYAPHECGSGSRNQARPGDPLPYVGFRVVLRLPRIPSSTHNPKDAEPATTSKPVPTFKNTLGMEFALVPKGKAWLGGGGGKPGDKEVEFKEDFYLGVYEVTQEEWEKVTGLNPSRFSRRGLAHLSVKDVSDEDLKRFPVEQVSWDDAQAFLKKLNDLTKETGWIYRLPTQDEWEYACRGGPSVDRFDSAYDFYVPKPTLQLETTHANFNNVLKRPCTVGSYLPNRLGLHDMHGNVWEWCDDMEKGEDGIEKRARRGGGYVYNSGDCRAAHRDPNEPSRRTLECGLRIARVRALPRQTSAAYTNPLGMEFALIPKGEAWLGGGGGKPGDREVEFNEDFYLGVYEVTQEEWEKVTRATQPSYYSRNGIHKDKVKDIPDEELKKFPVDNVSWSDAELFLKKLNERDPQPGWIYRLPTPDEWEYACRGGPGERIDCDFDYYFDKPTNEPRRDQGNFGPGLGRTCKVGMYKPNRLGLHDMHGNLFEWCIESGRTGGTARWAVLRGGGFPHPTGAARAANRVSTRNPKGHDFGFRVARVPVGASPKFNILADYAGLVQGRTWVAVVPSETEFERLRDANAFVGVEATYQEGCLELRAAKQAGHLSIPLEAADAIVRAKVKYGNGETLSLSLRATADESPKPNSKHKIIAWLRSSACGIVAMTGGPPRDLTELYQLTANDWVELAIAAVGPKVSVYLDGVKVMEATDPAPQRGALTLGVLKGGSTFRDIEMLVLDQQPTPPDKMLQTFPRHKNPLGMEFALVPKGKAWLGGGGGKPGDREVEFKEDFYLGIYEVTQEEWDKVMRAAQPSAYARNGTKKDAVKEVTDDELKRFPVENVSWDDAELFLKKLNERDRQSGWVYRLPTPDEWEYACRAGPCEHIDSDFDYYFEKPTNKPLREQANFGPGLGRTCKVGSYPPNRLGLHDMHGNVQEWCSESGQLGGAASWALLRGGSFNVGFEVARAANRWFSRLVKSPDWGFRVARVTSTAEPKSLPDYAGLVEGRPWTRLLPTEAEFQRLKQAKAFSSGEAVFQAGLLELRGITPPRRYAQLDIPGNTLDALLRAKVKFGTGECLWIQLRVSDPKSHWFSAWLRPRACGLNVMRNGRLIDLAEEYQLRADDVVELAIAAVGPKVTLYLDGRKVLEVVDSAPRPGGYTIGVNGASSFRDIEVAILDEVMQMPDPKVKDPPH